MILFKLEKPLYDVYSDIMMCFSKAVLAVEKQTSKAEQTWNWNQHQVPVGANGV